MCINNNDEISSVTFVLNGQKERDIILKKILDACITRKTTSGLTDADINQGLKESYREVKYIIDGVLVKHTDIRFLTSEDGKEKLTYSTSNKDICPELAFVNGSLISPHAQ